MIGKESVLKHLYKEKKILVTGHTGFKGSWMCETLLNYGANVSGYALAPPTNPSLFESLNLRERMHSVIGDIRDYEQVCDMIESVKPDIVIHMAAQPIVRESYRKPRETYETNVMGTVNILEAVRKSDSVRSFLNVTTDKVYKNREWEWGYRENEELDGFDPYSNSKSCSELVTNSYKRSFLAKSDGIPRVAISTARAGNVIGGGDFAKDRILPDCIRAAMNKEDIVIRNPYSVRPYQHVLEPVFAYLMIAAKQLVDTTYAGNYNVGPNEEDCCSTGELADTFVKYWGGGINWVDKYDGGPHEAAFLKLDCSKIKSIFGWHPVWNVDKAVKKTVEWTKYWQSGDNVRACTEKQIKEYIADFEMRNRL